MSRYVFALFFLLSLEASAQAQPFGTTGGTFPSMGALPGSTSQPGVGSPSGAAVLPSLPPTAGTTFPSTLGGAAGSIRQRLGGGFETQEEEQGKCVSTHIVLRSS